MFSLRSMDPTGNIFTHFFPAEIVYLQATLMRIIIVVFFCGAYFARNADSNPQSWTYKKMSPHDVISI